ncbi:unnamed protein product [Schistocephalus solidus]|uniref:Splicing factor 3B subunit 4 n=1 Tax=Schistocephalus solidus TaxID=70667 RepID=A0A183SC06_SCHSO|nr:unnamed protein product [Schistocephalus solidus]
MSVVEVSSFPEGSNKGLGHLHADLFLISPKAIYCQSPLICGQYLIVGLNPLTLFFFSSYGFVEFLTEEDADYAMRIMNMIKLYNKPIRVNKASANQKNLDIGANIFIGNLDPEVDEKLLYDTFSAFGVILQTPKIMRDPETGNSKGYAFINFASFEAIDAAIEAMNGQYLCNRAIAISYAFKKDSKGEHHGSAAERLLAAQSPLSHVPFSFSVSVTQYSFQCLFMARILCKFCWSLLS